MKLDADIGKEFGLSGKTIAAFQGWKDGGSFQCAFVDLLKEAKTMKPARVSTTHAEGDANQLHIGRYYPFYGRWDPSVTYHRGGVKTMPIETDPLIQLQSTPEFPLIVTGSGGAGKTIFSRCEIRDRLCTDNDAKIGWMDVSIRDVTIPAKPTVDEGWKAALEEARGLLKDKKDTALYDEISAALEYHEKEWAKTIFLSMWPKAWGDFETLARWYDGKSDQTLEGLVFCIDNLGSNWEFAKGVMAAYPDIFEEIVHERKLCNKLLVVLSGNGLSCVFPNRQETRSIRLTEPDLAKMFGMS